MEFRDTVTVHSTGDELWESISNPQILMKCVPGAREVVKRSETKYEGTVERSVAGLTLTMHGEAEIVELNPPDKVVVEASGEDKKTNSSMTANAEMSIRTERETSRLIYSVDVELNGRLATIGARILKGRVKSDIDKFFDNLKEEVESS